MADNYFRTLRKRANLSQEQLVSELSVGLSTYKLWEGGKAYPDIRQIFELEVALAKRNVEMPLAAAVRESLAADPFGRAVEEPRLTYTPTWQAKVILPPVEFYEQFQAYGGKTDWLEVVDERRQVLERLYRRCDEKIKSIATFYEAEFFKVLYNPGYQPLEEPPF